jgi:cytidine deaminase
MKNRNLKESFYNAVNGILYAIKKERNMKIHIAASVIILILSIFYKLSRIEFLIVCLTVAIVFVSELFNTAVEVLVDIITNLYHPKAKIIKDAAAGAVLFSASISIIIGYFIFYNRVSYDIKMVIMKIGQPLVYIAVIVLTAIALLALLLLFFKKRRINFKGRGKNMDDRALVKAACEVKENAYAPYSKFRVGAAVLTDDGSLYTGVNIENISYGATVCAERTAIFKAVSEGKGKVCAIAIASDSEDYIFPCGICRQVIFEFGDRFTKIICSRKNGEYRIFTAEELLPHAFMAIKT